LLLPFCSVRPLREGPTTRADRASENDPVRATLPRFRDHLRLEILCGVRERNRSDVRSDLADRGVRALDVGHREVHVHLGGRRKGLPYVVDGHATTDRDGEHCDPVKRATPRRTLDSSGTLHGASSSVEARPLAEKRVAAQQRGACSADGGATTRRLLGNAALARSRPAAYKSLVDLKALSAIELPDSAGVSRLLGSFWREQPAVVVFLRHFG
jgi:hypothetical protein